MRRKRSLLEDLISIVSRLPWRVGVAAAVLSWAALHLATVLAGGSKTPAAVSDLGPYAVRSLFGTMAEVLQYIAPVCFLIGAFASRVRQSRDQGLFKQAHFGGEDAVRRMTWRDFERLVGEAFRRRGYDVTRSEPGPDGGVDLIATKGRERVLVQCKHWRARRVGVKVVRELYGVVVAKHASAGYVVTSGVFTEEAREFAQGSSIELIDGNRLSSLIREVGRTAAEGATTAEGRAPGPAPQVPDLVGPRCPQCGSGMAKRTAARGPRVGEAFWGCPRFPVCRGTRPMQDAVTPLLGSPSASE